jgi:glyoxylase-like metal-dependent hydrolase (beta-lactamase superfamily II)
MHDWDGPRWIAADVCSLGPWGRTQTNVFLLRSDDGWVLVDAGWERDADRIMAAVRSLAGRSARPVAVVLTHCHPDHSGAARTLARAWGCPVFMHPDELPIARGDLAAMNAWAGPLDGWIVLPALRTVSRRRRVALLARSSLTDVAEPLDLGAAVPGLPEWACVPTPGHTFGHLSFFRASDRVLLSGDALLTLQVNTWAGLLTQRQGVSGPPWYTTWDPAASASSLRALADLRPSCLGSGHGWPRTDPQTADDVAAFAVAARTTLLTCARNSSGSSTKGL